MRELAKTLAQEMPNILHHRRRHAKKTDLRRTGGASPASCHCQVVNELNSFVPLSPTSFQRNHHQPASVPCQQFGVLVFFLSSGPRTHRSVLERCVWVNCAVCCLGAPQRDVDGESGRHTPQMARSSFASTAMSMTLNLTLKRTVAPAFLHTRATVRSVAAALVRNLPERLHAARWRPKMSNSAPHSWPLPHAMAVLSSRGPQCGSVVVRL